MGLKKCRLVFLSEDLIQVLKIKNIYCVSIVFIFIFIKMWAHASLGGLAQVDEKYIVLAGFLYSDLYFAFLRTVLMNNLWEYYHQEKGF